MAGMENNPVVYHLFDINDNTQLINNNTNKYFYMTNFKLLFLSKGARPDLQELVAFLTEQVNVGGPLQALFIKFFFTSVYQQLNLTNTLFSNLLSLKKNVHMSRKSDINKNLFQTSLRYASMNLFF